jgi:hypothetical protein
MGIFFSIFIMVFLSNAWKNGLSEPSRYVYSAFAVFILLRAASLLLLIHIICVFIQRDDQRREDLLKCISPPSQLFELCEGLFVWRNDEHTPFQAEERNRVRGDAACTLCQLAANDPMTHNYIQRCSLHFEIHISVVRNMFAVPLTHSMPRCVRCCASKTNDEPEKGSLHMAMTLTQWRTLNYIQCVRSRGFPSCASRRAFMQFSCKGSLLI